MLAIFCRPRARGFTLTELLVVVAIIVLLTAIVVPNVVQARTRAAMTKTEADLKNLAAALELYKQAFGSYPGDVFPSEDANNDGVLEADDANSNGFCDPGEGECGVDVDGDGTPDYALTHDGLIQAGDGVINIRDLEWALRTTARGGPFIDEFPRDGWGQQYVYAAPITRDLDAASVYLYLDPTTIVDEDLNRNGRLDANEDIGIATYATTIAAGPGTRTAGFTALGAGAGNGILDHGDDDNKDGLITHSSNAANDTLIDQWEIGNQDISPDGYARNRGYYLYSVGLDGVDQTASGYEDITGNNLLNTDVTASPPLTSGATLRNPPTLNGGNTEDINNSVQLEIGWEDVGPDGRPNTKDQGELDGELSGTAPAFLEEDYLNFDGTDASGTADATVVDAYHSPNYSAGPPVVDPTLDVGGDDINSWNETRPWRDHESYN